MFISSPLEAYTVPVLLLSQHILSPCVPLANKEHTIRLSSLYTCCAHIKDEQQFRSSETGSHLNRIKGIDGYCSSFHLLYNPQGPAIQRMSWLQKSNNTAPRGYCFTIVLMHSFQCILSNVSLSSWAKCKPFISLRCEPAARISRTSMQPQAQREDRGNRWLLFTSSSLLRSPQCNGSKYDKLNNVASTRSQFRKHTNPPGSGKYRAQEAVESPFWLTDNTVAEVVSRPAHHNHTQGSTLINEGEQSDRWQVIVAWK